MNVLQALFFPPEQPGGVSSMVPFVQNRFLEMGWEMDLFSLPKRVRKKGSGGLPFRQLQINEFEGDPIVDKYIQTFRDYIWWTNLRLQGRTFDLIHAHHPIAALAMKQQFPDVPVIATIHSSYERELLLNGKIETGSKAHRFLTQIYAEMEQQVDHIVTVSDSFRSYLSPLIRHPEKVEVLPNGYDEKRFRPIMHNNPVTQFITVCRLVPAKGLDVLLKACAKLKKQGLPYVLHVIGDGPMRPELEQLAEQLGIYEDIIFYGYMLHPNEFMPFSDVFVLPSRAEAFGSVFAEAALCKLALIGTSVGGIAEQIRHQENGMLIPLDDIEALADAMALMIRNPDTRMAMAERACQIAMGQYSLERVIDRLANLYRQFGKLN